MKKASLFLSLITAMVMAPLASAETIRYKIDTVHSGITFKVRHFINQVPGTFTQFEGEIHFNPENPADNKAVANIDVNTVDTRSDRRDNHLRSDDFFGVDDFPTMKYESDEWHPMGDGRFHVTGHLTLLGETHPVEMIVHYLGEVEGNDILRSGWVGETTIDRTLWGMDYGVGGPLGSTVQIELNIQAHRQD